MSLIYRKRLQNRLSGVKDRAGVDIEEIELIGSRSSGWQTPRAGSVGRGVYCATCVLVPLGPGVRVVFPA
jgi:hypothetical protein